MAQDRFARASLLQGAIAPTSAGNVSVGVGKDPALAEESAFYGNFSKRMDAFAAESNKLAAAKAKAAGAAYGARNPVTKQQLQEAALLGKPPEIVGDPNSINIFQQAAYAGSVAVTESQFTAQGRRALTNAMAEVAMDDTMTPQKFSAKVDSIVTEYSQMMAQISPSSGAKVSASLASMANGQIVSYSRTYATNQRKALKDDAYAGLATIRDSLTTDVDGVLPGGEITLKELYATRRKEAENLLINSGETQKTVNSQLTQLDKAWVQSQKNAILSWGQAGDYANNTGKAYTDLASGKATKRVQAIFDNLDSNEKTKLLGNLLTIHNQQDSLANAEAEGNKTATEKQSMKLQEQLNDAEIAGNTDEYQKVLKQLNKIDPETARKYINEKRDTPRNSDNRVVRDSLEDDIADPNYDLKVEIGEKESLLARISEAVRKGQLSRPTAQDMRSSVMARQNEDFKTAMDKAAIAFNYEPGGFFNPTDEMKANKQRYKKVEFNLKIFFKKNPEADLVKAVESFIADEQPTPETFEQLIAKLPEDLRNITAWKKLMEKTDSSSQMLRNEHGVTVTQIKKLYGQQWQNTATD